MHTTAVVLTAPRQLSVETVRLAAPSSEDVVVDIVHSGISTGTEKLLWTGEMPPFPGMGYPLIPGYEAMGYVAEAPRSSGLVAGDAVFVPGANCFDGVRGLFGAAAARIASAPARLVKLDRGVGAGGALLALAATAHHALDVDAARPPDLIVGHGVLGRLIAKLSILRGAPPPTVWEVDPARMSGDGDYAIMHPDDDARRDYGSIYDASGDASLLDSLIGRLRRGGEVVLAGFYAAPISFAFPPAFMKEARLRIAAEWAPSDIAAVRGWMDSGELDLATLITHRAPAERACDAYATAFSDSTCLKMILDWRTSP